MDGWWIESGKWWWESKFACRFNFREVQNDVPEWFVPWMIEKESSLVDWHYGKSSSANVRQPVEELFNSQQRSASWQCLSFWSNETKLLVRSHPGKTTRRVSGERDWSNQQFTSMSSILLQKDVEESEAAKSSEWVRFLFALTPRRFTICSHH
jgi:hypothetical protein